jgi:hypothetical protein
MQVDHTVASKIDAWARLCDAVDIPGINFLIHHCVETTDFSFYYIFDFYVRQCIGVHRSGFDGRSLLVLRP